jgi:hypothetical protein
MIGHQRLLAMMVALAISGLLQCIVSDTALSPAEGMLILIVLLGLLQW